jgi:hypothetical protein
MHPSYCEKGQRPALPGQAGEATHSLRESANPSESGILETSSSGRIRYNGREASINFHSKTYGQY